MRKLYICLSIAALAGNLSAQTLWTGPTMTFTKANFVDVTLEENQDRITDNVWITRNNTRGIFNAFSETVYSDFSSPAGTEWAFGTIADGIETLTFNDWESTHGSEPIDNMLNLDMVVHLITDDIYIDIKFTAWQMGLGQGQPGGGGFTYERSTDSGVSVSENVELKLNLFPNPATEFISVDGLSETSTYSVLDQLSRVVLQGQILPQSRIDVSGLNKGFYFLRLEGHKELIRFQKN